jgi:predicted nicotinamide N-methyase
MHNHEEDDDDDDDDDDFRGPITFHIQLPSRYSNNNHQQRRLKFSCRDKSSGVLLKSEPSVLKEDTFDGPCDPFFFEKGFYLEAKTGFQVWPGSRLMVEAFTCHNGDGYPSFVCGMTNVLEVGAGIGVVGSCLAAAGANVLITDLPVLVQHGIRPNLRRNGRRAVAEAAGEEVDHDHGMQQCPEFLREASSLSLSDDNLAFDAVRLGEGWANTAVLDWFKPVEEQLPTSVTTAIDVIVACDCIFLRKLADPLLSTIATIFEHSKARNPIFFFTFQRRNMLGLFIQLEELLGRIEERGWTVECVAWRNVEIEDDGCHENYLFRVTPASMNDSLLSVGRADFIEEKKE